MKILLGKKTGGIVKLSLIVLMILACTLLIFASCKEKDEPKEKVKTELVKEIDFKLMNIINEYNYLAGNTDTYPLGEYEYTVSQDTKKTLDNTNKIVTYDCYTVYIKPRENPLEQPNLNAFEFRYFDDKLYYTAQITTLIGETTVNIVDESSFTYDSVFKPEYGDNGIDYDKISKSLLEQSGYIADNWKNNAVYLKNYFDWDANVLIANEFRKSDAQLSEKNIFPGSIDALIFISDDEYVSGNVRISEPFDNNRKERFCTLDYWVNYIFDYNLEDNRLTADRQIELSALKMRLQ